MTTVSCHQKAIVDYSILPARGKDNQEDFVIFLVIWWLKLFLTRIGYRIAARLCYNCNEHSYGPVAAFSARRPG
jgi:hypothetical protein